MMKKLLAAILFSAATLACAAQNSLGGYMQQLQNDFDQYSDDLKAEHRRFWQDINREFAEFMARPWTPVRLTEPTPVPVVPEPRPVTIDDDDHGDDIVIIHRDTVIPVVTVVTPPEPRPQPRPVVPIEDDRKPTPRPVPKYNFTFWGTAAEVDRPDIEGYNACDGSRNYSDAWMYLANHNFDRLAIDVLALRDKHRLCDWAYIGMLEQLSASLCYDNNLAQILYGFLLSRSGYNFRYLREPVSGMLVIGIATDWGLYNRPLYFADNCSFYLPEDCKDIDFEVCDWQMPGAEPVRMAYTRNMDLSLSPSSERVVPVKYTAASDTLSARTNTNLITFMNTYPKVFGDGKSPWQIVANFPFDSYLRDQLYPQLRRRIERLDEVGAARYLLKVCQSFPYGYDDKIWGYDYPLTVEQTWYHLQSDCEDHAIHFSRLVRDLLGLRTVLIYLPGHLVAGIQFRDHDFEGTYVALGDEQFLVCDPTYFGADLGSTFVTTTSDETTVYLLD